jgi:hypothetical protein
MTTTEIENDIVASIIDRSSSYNKLISIIQWLIVFNNKFKRQIQNEHLKIRQDYTLKEISEHLLALSKQKSKNSDLTQIKTIQGYIVTKHPLGAFTVTSRIQHSATPYLLTNNSKLLTLYIQKIHNEYFHSSIISTFSLTIKKYWKTGLMKDIKLLKKTMHTMQTL